MAVTDEPSVAPVTMAAPVVDTDAHDGHDHATATDSEDADIDIADPDVTDPDGNALGQDSDAYWANKDYVETESTADKRLSSKQKKQLADGETTLIHKLRVVYFTKAGSPPPNPATDAQLRAFFEGSTNSISSYWQDMTNGAIKLEVESINRIEMPSTYSCTNNSDSDVDNSIGRLWARAKTDVLGGRNLNDREHIMAIWPQISGTTCTFGLAGAPSVASLNHGGNVFALFDGSGQEHLLSKNGFSHEFGHNLGLRHSHGVYCTDGNGELVDNAGCTAKEYGDFFDTMGRNDDGGVPQISTSAKDKLGVLGRTVTTVTVTGGTREFTIEPLDMKPNKNAGDEALESIKIIDPENGRPYYVELRSEPTDWRSATYWNGLNAPSFSFPNTRVTDDTWPRAITSDYGVRILRIGTDTSQGGHRLGGNRLGQNPITMETGSLSRSSWKAGEEFVTRNGKVRIKVVSIAANNASAVIRVTLPDAAGPVISGATNRTVEAKSAFAFDARAGVTAMDDGDGDITDRIRVYGSVNMNWPGRNALSYSVSDTAGNSVQASRIITVVDTTKPTLTVPGGADLPQGASFDPRSGVRASDLVDGDLTGAVAIAGSVDTATPGDYTLTYSVADSAGNTATVQRVIRVLAPIVIDPPTGSGGGTGTTGGTGSTGGSGATKPGSLALTQTGANSYTSTYGRAVLIPVRVGAETQHVSGSIDILIDGKKTGTSPVHSGRGTAAIPATLAAGTHSVTIRLNIDGAVAVDKSITLKVLPAPTTVSVKVPKKVKAGKSAKVTVTVKVPGASVSARGKVRVYVGKKLVKTATLKKAKQAITLPKKALPTTLAGKKAKVRIAFVATKNFKSSKSAVKTTRVR
ncbi:immunoglobulin-like domain-containing protein [Rarobacter faecitabidus]|uniref:immunoglobulin-like domain-containing protein n=1 Tax=Rarobacter faecitabidus TaxID=13243 RepID=UPI0014768C84|nr:immunoglobulin-like domain-containing protein [Rarobacter faecitabidus]